MKVGDTVTDGNFTYVYDRDLILKKVDSGGHAKQKISHKKLLSLLEKYGR